MTENIALDAARAFAEMSEHAQAQCIDVTATNLMLLDNRNVSLRRDSFEKVAKELLEKGHLEAFTCLNLERRVFAVQEFLAYSTPIELFILLDEIKNGVPFKMMREDRNISFQDFDTELSYLFFHRFDKAFQHPGTEDFRRVLHRYFEAFGPWKEYDSELGVTRQRAGTSDSYMMLSALVLRSAYGERRVMLLLDKMIRDSTPIPALDFVKIIRSNVDYSHYPLSWAATLA